MISFFIKPLLETRPEDKVKTLIMFFYFFFVIALVYILKPVRNALLITELGAHNLRFVYMGEGLFLIFIVWAYLQIAKRVSKKKLYDAGLTFFIACLGMFWFLFQMNVSYLSACFYIWVAAFSITMTTQFWTLANDIFDPDEAKRLFGVMISSGSIGGIAGGLFTQYAIRWLKTEELLLVAAGIVGLCLCLVNALWKHVPRLERPAIQSSSHQFEEESGISSVKTLFGSSYLMMIAAFVMISKIASTVIDNQFSSMVEINILGKEARTAYFGGFSAALNLISFGMQFFVTGFCLSRLGVGRSLAILP
ncbi:MAG TPA: MFS transporter, partial [bacterium]|nr:MFS transporter [bacterium]